MSALAVELEAAPTVARIEIPLAGYVAATKAVTVAAGTDASLPILTGVNVTVLTDGLRLVSTDRYRLSEATYGTGEAVGSLLVSAKELAAFSRALKVSGPRWAPVASVSVEIAGGRLTVSGGDVSRTFDVVGQEFPPYAHLIEGARTNPQGDVSVMRFASKYLGDGMDAVALMSDGRAKDVGARFTIRDAERPCLIEPDSPIEGWAFVYLLMPRKAPR